MRVICAASRRCYGWFILNHEKSRPIGVGETRGGEVAMKTTVLIILTVTVLIVGVLAVLNNACKSGQHAWCASMSSVHNHIKLLHRAWL